MKENKAQISIELIIIMAAVIAIVLLMVTKFQEFSTKGAQKFEAKADDVFSEIDKIK